MVVKCKICEREFKSDNTSALTLKLNNHIRREHNSTVKDYYVEFFNDGKVNLCFCGCGNEVNFVKGKFLKYYKNHKNKIPYDSSVIEKMRLINSNKSFENKLSKFNLTIENLREYYNNFINDDLSLISICRKISMDKRTLKKYWFDLGFIEDPVAFKKIVDQTRGSFATTIVEPKIKDFNILVDELPNIIDYIKNIKKPTTPNTIIKLFKLNVRVNFFKQFLKNNIDKELYDKYLKIHNSSFLEIEFLNVLHFYFGKNVIHHFKLDGYEFDYNIGGILIELDGEYWHSRDDTKKRDNIKTIISQKNGYYLIRIPSKKVNNVNTLINIINKNNEINKI